MPPNGQELVRSLFDYVIAYTQIKTPYARNIVQQPWFQYLGEVPQHETVQFNLPASSDTAYISGEKPPKLRGTLPESAESDYVRTRT